MRDIRRFYEFGSGRTVDKQLVIQTICGTGIRISESSYVIIEAVRKGEAAVSCKGKTRVIFIISSLRKNLLKYAKSKK